MTRSKTGRTLPILAMGLLLAGCATSPVGELAVPVEESCVAPIGAREYRPPMWLRPSNYPVTRRFLPVSGGGQFPLLTGNTQYDPGIRVRPYYRPWSVEPVGERIYYRQPLWGGRIYDALTRSWERCSPFEPVSLTSPSEWW